MLNEKEEIDAMLAHMILGLGLPLSLVEAPAFIEFYRKLRHPMSYLQEG